MANKKKKVVSTVAAVATAAALLLGGTLAWQSANQVALNEASDVINPGGRLHDDFNGENKDVYVENFIQDEDGDAIFARIRLEEYFEIVTNHGTEVEKVHTLVGTTTPTDAARSTDNTGKKPIVNIGSEKGEEYERGYRIFTFDDVTTDEETGVTTVKAAVDEDGNAWWTWTLGGQTTFMPTFNLNKDSLMADVNGKFNGAVGVITDKDGHQYDGTGDPASTIPYVEYTDGDPKTAWEVYDGDPNDIDEIETQDELKALIDEGTNNRPDNIVLSDTTVEHTAKATGTATIMSMAEWKALPEGEQVGPYWVYDTDGWVYWAQPILPGEATGLLLDGIQLNQVMDDTWYYAINVVAQFVTADDVGKFEGTGTGFYDAAKGSAPSDDAETLLEKIGVTSLSDGEQPGEDEPTATVDHIAMTAGGMLDNYSWEDLPYLPSDAANSVTLTAYDADGNALTEGITWSADSTMVSVADGVVSATQDAAAISSTVEEITVTAADANGGSADYTVYLYNANGHMYFGTVENENGTYYAFTPSSSGVPAMDDEPALFCISKKGAAPIRYFEYFAHSTTAGMLNRLVQAYEDIAASGSTDDSAVTDHGPCPHFGGSSGEEERTIATAYLETASGNAMNPPYLIQKNESYTVKATNPDGTPFDDENPILPEGFENAPHTWGFYSNGEFVNDAQTPLNFTGDDLADGMGIYSGADGNVLTLDWAYLYMAGNTLADLVPLADMNGNHFYVYNYTTHTFLQSYDHNGDTYYLFEGVSGEGNICAIKVGSIVTDFLDTGAATVGEIDFDNAANWGTACGGHGAPLAITAINSDDAHSENGNVYIAPGETATFTFEGTSGVTNTNVKWTLARYYIDNDGNSGSDVSEESFLLAETGDDEYSATITHSCADEDSCTHKSYYYKLSANIVGYLASNAVNFAGSIYPNAYSAAPTYEVSIGSDASQYPAGGSLEVTLTAAVTADGTPVDLSAGDIAWTAMAGKNDITAALTDNGDGTATLNTAGQSSDITVTAAYSDGASGSVTITALPNEEGEPTFAVADVTNSNTLYSNLAPGATANVYAGTEVQLRSSNSSTDWAVVGADVARLGYNTANVTGSYFHINVAEGTAVGTQITVTQTVGESEYTITLNVAEDYELKMSGSDGVVQSGDDVVFSLYKYGKQVQDAAFTLTVEEGVTLQSGTELVYSTLYIADKEGIFNGNETLTITAAHEGEEVATQQLTIKQSELSMDLSVANYFRAYRDVANAVTLDTNSIKEKETGAALTVDELNFKVTGYTVTKNGQDVTADVFDEDAMTFTANDAALPPDHVKFIITANYTTDPLGAGSVSTEVKAQEYQIWAKKGVDKTWEIPRARVTLIWDTPDGEPQNVYEVQYLKDGVWTTSENSALVLHGGGSNFGYFYFYADQEPAFETADEARIIMKGDETNVRYKFTFLN